MKTYRKVAVIGGTGRAGSHLVKRLSDEGYAVRLLLRHPEACSFSHPLSETLKGSATDSVAIHNLLEGCTAVMSTLGQRKGERPPFSEATRHVLEAMRIQGISRYVLVTGLSIVVPTDRKGWRTRWLSWLMRKSFPATIADKQAEWELQANSKTEWTLLRLPRIWVTDVRRSLCVGLCDCPGTEIGTADLAQFLVDELEQKRYLRQAPFVANG